MEALSDEKAVKLARKLSICVVKSYPEGTRDYIIARPEDIVSAGKNIHRAMDSCLGKTVNTSSEIRFTHQDLQGFLAEAWLQKTMPALAVSSVSSHGDEPSWTRSDLAHASLYQTVACVTRLHPEFAKALVVSQPGHDDEAQAFSEILPVLKDCIDPRAAFRATRLAVRLAVAIAIFRRAYDPAST